MGIDGLSAPGENSEINQNYIKSPEVILYTKPNLSSKLNLMLAAASKSIDLVAHSMLQLLHIHSVIA